MKKLSFRLMAPAVVLSFSCPIFAAEKFPSPFGLEWGMSHAELQAVGFSAPKPLEDFEYATSVSTPKPWSQGNSYFALSYKDKLVKAIVESKPITDDVYGSEGKALYSSVKSILVKKYGNPSSEFEHTGMKLYDDADEFYQCLEYSGCGGYMASFSVGGGSIQVSIEGSRRGQGNVKITYESPAFYNAKEAIEAQDAKSDSSAF
ncbi:hypothetical protein [Marinomonas pontica]